jgi:ACDE family multidrug resistance protein
MTITQQELTPPEKNKLPHLLKTRNMQLIIVIAMVTMYGGSVISPALPSIQQAFNIETSSIGLLMTAFSFPGIISIPIAGILSDRYGRRKIVVPLLLLYGIAGTLCFFAPSYEILVSLRFLSGIGAGAIATLTLTLIGDLFQGRERTEALGYRIAFGQASTGIFPIFGGLLAVISWRYPFLLFILAIPVGFLALAILGDETARNKSTIREYLSEVTRGLLNARTASLLTVAPTLMIINQGIIMTFLPVYLGYTFGVSAAIIGLVISVRVIAGVIGASSMGVLTDHMREEWLLIWSLAVLALGVSLVPFVTSVWLMIGPVLLIGAASGIGFPAFQSLLVGEAPKQLMAGIMSANGVTNRIGQALGPIIASALYGVGGFNAVFFGGALFLMIMIIFLSQGFRKHLRAKH